MNPFDLEARALRQTWAVGCLAFAVGFGLVVASMVYLFVKYVFPQDGWWALPQAIWHTAFLSFVGGCALTLPSMKLLNWLQYRRGLYRCTRCGRTLQAERIPCACRMNDPQFAPLFPSAKLKPRRRLLRHDRRYLPRVIVAYVATMPLALAFATLRPNPRHFPLLRQVALSHLLVVVFVFVGGRVLQDVLEWFGKGQRLRLQSIVFIRVFTAVTVPCDLALTWMSHISHK
jgi:hypothetical protein